MTVSIVVGLGFGDEGKGVVTSSLVQSLDTIVVRFNGGHQAGHTVIQDGHRHVFSSFGSGSLKGVSTYWSKYCTIYPTAILNEFELLKGNIGKAKLFIDPLCPVTTWLDIKANQTIRASSSVGVGFGRTLQRQEDHRTLYAKDLLSPKVLSLKLDAIEEYYKYLGFLSVNQDRKHFEEDCRELVNHSVLSYKGAHSVISFKRPDLHNYDHIVFEGAQGILLDQNYGFFPHVTRSNTTSKNALKILKEYEITRTPDIYMVTRAYHTRHGIGPFTDEPITLINNENETNVRNTYQGEFRVADLDLDLLQYAIECEENTSLKVNKLFRNIVITCCDQVEKLPSFYSSYDTIFGYSPEKISLKPERTKR